MAGRTHGIHAEPITFGSKLALWALQLRRDRVRLERAREAVAVGKVSGAVGSYSNVDPQVEAYVCEQLGLRPAPSTQVIARDRHAELLYACAALGSSIESFALEVRHLQRTEVGEVQEPFAGGRAEGLRARCRTSATRGAPSSSAVSPACCAATSRPGSRTSRCGTSATCRTRRSSASSSPIR